MRLAWIRVGPKCNDECPCKRQKRKHAEIKAMGRQKREESDAATSQGMTRTASNPQKLGEKQRMDSSSEAPGGPSTANALISDLEPQNYDRVGAC